MIFSEMKKVQLTRNHLHLGVEPQEADVKVVLGDRCVSRSSSGSFGTYSKVHDGSDSAGRLSPSAALLLDLILSSDHFLSVAGKTSPHVPGQAEELGRESAANYSQ